MTAPILRPTVAEIDLQKLARNLQKIHTRVQGVCPINQTGRVKVLTLLKANAYGHGAVAIGQFLEKNKLSDFFAVASVEEGLSLRQSGLKTPILVLGSLFTQEAFEAAITADLSVTVASLQAAKTVARAAEKVGKMALCHVKQDTGMGRIGTRLPAIISVLEFVHQHPQLILEGFYSHLSCVETDPDYTAWQVQNFRQAVDEAHARGITIQNVHLAASAATFIQDDLFFDMVRHGHSIYGLEKDFEPILTLKTRVVFTKILPPEYSVSYNRSFRTDKPLQVATLPVGYGDGYLRALSNKADVLINGTRCRVLGNITMDMMMVDVSRAAHVKNGDEVVLVGRQGNDEITLAELAQKAGTIDYELCTLLMPRVPRIYK